MLLNYFQTNDEAYLEITLKQAENLKLFIKVNYDCKHVLYNIKIYK